MNVDLNIDELIVHGLDPTEQHRLGPALERELTRLFETHGVPPALTRSRTATRLALGDVQVDPAGGADAVSVQLAQALYQGLSR
jgi:hypothetical protein